MASAVPAPRSTWMLSVFAEPWAPMETMGTDFPAMASSSRKASSEASTAKMPSTGTFDQMWLVPLPMTETMSSWPSSFTRRLSSRATWL